MTNSYFSYEPCGDCVIVCYWNPDGSFRGQESIWAEFAREHSEILISLGHAPWAANDNFIEPASA